MAALNTLVSEAVDVVVQCARTKQGLRVTEIACVEDLAGGAGATQFTLTSVYARDRADGPLTWTGELPVRAARPLREAGHDVRDLLTGSRLEAVARAAP
jgi:hypothetical protein